MPLECTSQFQNGIHFPLGMGGEQEAQPISWLHNRDSQHMMLSEDPNLLPQRQVLHIMVTYGSWIILQFPQRYSNSRILYSYKPAELPLRDSNYEISNALEVPLFQVILVTSAQESKQILIGQHKKVSSMT